MDGASGLLKQLLSDINPAQRAGATMLGMELNPPGGQAPDNTLPPGAKLGPDGMVYIPVYDEVEGKYSYELAPQWVQKAYGVIGDGGGAAGPTAVDWALLRLKEQAQAQSMDIAASEEQRAAEAFPLQMQQTQTDIETTEANLQRQILSDKFTVAQEQWNASYLADQLATAKRRDAANTLVSLIDHLVPAGQTYLPGLEPGSSLAFPGGAGVPVVGSVNFGALTQGLSPETDAALRYLQQQGQQTTTGLTGLQGV